MRREADRKRRVWAALPEPQPVGDEEAAGRRGRGGRALPTGNDPSLRRPSRTTIRSAERSTTTRTLRHLSRNADRSTPTTRRASRAARAAARVAVADTPAPTPAGRTGSSPTPSRTACGAAGGLGHEVGRPRGAGGGTPWLADDGGFGRSGPAAASTGSSCFAGFAASAGDDSPAPAHPAQTSAATARPNPPGQRMRRSIARYASRSEGPAGVRRQVADQLRRRAQRHQVDARQPFDPRKLLDQVGDRLGALAALGPLGQLGRRPRAHLLHPRDPLARARDGDPCEHGRALRHSGLPAAPTTRQSPPRRARSGSGRSAPASSFATSPSTGAGPALAAEPTR